MARTRQHVPSLIAAMAAVASLWVSSPSDLPAQQLGMSAYEGGRGFYLFRFLNGTKFEVGDTLWVRHVLYNVADSALAVRTRPCGFWLGGTLELITPQGTGLCEPIINQIVPGDSVWADLRGVVSSPPGEYTLQVDYASLPRYDSVRREPQATAITVQARDPRPKWSAYSRSQPLMPKLPYIVQISSDSSFINVREIEVIVGEAIRDLAWLPMHASERAANEIAEIWPYLVIHLAESIPGRYRLETSWVSRVAYPGDQQEAEIPARASCKSWKEGPTASTAIFGATLVNEVRDAVEGYLSGRCGQ